MADNVEAALIVAPVFLAVLALAAFLWLERYLRNTGVARERAREDRRKVRLKTAAPVAPQGDAVAEAAKRVIPRT